MDLFRCPICTAQLQRHEGALRCDQGHSFDLSREGYVNLLPSHHRKSLAPGDSAEMVAARRRFLGHNHYRPLVDALADILGSVPRSDTLLDLGCGEGSFTDSYRGRVSQVYGVDISKPAIKAAAKRFKTVSLAVASTAQLPFSDGAFDVITIMMAPMGDDVIRLLTEDGVVIRVTPGPTHLSVIKGLIYREAREHPRAPLQLPQLLHTREERLQFSIDLDTSSRSDLLAMTPMQYRSSPDRRAQADGPSAIEVSADFWIDVFTRDS